MDLKMNLDIELMEKSLLTGKWDSEKSASSQSAIADLIKDVVNGAFREPLTSSYAREIFKIRSNVDLDQPLDSLFNLSASTVDDERERELLRLTLGIACLHAFVQANWTGPNLDVKPSDVIVVSPETHSITDDILDAKAISELAYGGEPAYHLAESPTFLRLAQLLINPPYQHIQSAAWWRLRVALVHQQILDEPVALPQSVLSSLDPLIHDIATHPHIAGRLLLEQGLLEHHFTHDKSAADYFIRAARATGLQYELTGALGKRTKFQQTELSQLVLLAESRETEVTGNGRNATEPPAGDEDVSDTQATANVPEALALNDDTLLERTEFTSSTPSASNSLLSHLNPGNQPPLHPLDQCILLSLCLNVRNTSPSHGLTSEQMSPYVERVISHPRNWSIHTMALLLRSRLESSRTRTVERSTLQLQALVDQMPTADSTTSERLLYFHSIPLPSKWEMERELALRFLSLGVVKSALEIFERLEMWEEVVKCWQSMERSDKAIAIVRDLLEGRKAEAEVVVSRGKATSGKHKQIFDSAREAKLWCLLGDLEPENALEHYNHAWSISKETSGRAMRSLGGYHFAQGNFAETITCLRRAVTINPLLSRSWFILGCAYIREEDWDGAKEAFSRVVMIDDEDGESWNNLASIYLRMGRKADNEDAKVSVCGARDLNLN
jgi:tetratricopeptide (TPR) repeat protein